MMWNRAFSPITLKQWHGFLLIGFVLFFSACTPTNESLSELTGETTSTKSTTVNGPLGNSALTFNPSSYNFPTLTTNGGSATKSFIVTNSSAYAVVLGIISGTNAQYSLTTNSCINGLNLAPGATCSFTVKFEPTLSGSLSTAIVIPYDATPGTNSFSASVNLTGAGSTLTAFAGLDSLNNETPVTMKLNWTDAVGASFYQIFRINGGVPTLVTSVLASANCIAGVCNYTAGGLVPLTSYTFRVRATDAFGVQEQNLVNRTSVTTNGYLVLTGNAPAQSFCAPFTITIQDTTFTPVNVATDTAITIGGVGNGLTYLDSSCVFPSPTPSVNTGTSSKIFYFKDATLETTTLTADLTNFTTATKSAIVFSPLATAFALSPTSGSTSNSTSPSITLTLPANDLNLSATATIYSAAGCATPVGNAAITATSQAISLTLSTQTTYTFYYKISNAGSTSACTTTGVTYTLDTTAPTIAIVAPATSYSVTNINQFAITVSGTCSEDTRTVSLLATGTASTSATASTTCNTGTYSTSIDLSTIGEGAVVLTATHTDLAGNSTTSPTATGTGLKTTCQASSTVLTTVGSITYNVPANCTYITGEAWGGGGGGAGGDANTTAIGNGGGGGYISGIIPVDTTASQTQSFTAVIGSGGGAGAAGNGASYEGGAGGGGGGSGIKNGSTILLVAGGGGGSSTSYSTTATGSGGPGGGTTGGNATAAYWPGFGGVWNGATISSGGGYPSSIINGGVGSYGGGAGGLGGTGGTGIGNGGAGGRGWNGAGGGGGGGLYGGSGGGGDGVSWNAGGGGGGASGVSGYIGTISAYVIKNTQGIGATAGIGDTTDAINDHANNASGTTGNGGAGIASSNVVGNAGKNGLVVVRTFYDNIKPVTPPGIFIITTSSAISMLSSWIAASDNVGGSGIATYQIALGSSAGATDYLTYQQGNVGNTTSAAISNFILPVSTTVYPSIRALDYNGNPSSVVNGTPFITPATFKISLYPAVSFMGLSQNIAVSSAVGSLTIKSWGAGGAGGNAAPQGSGGGGGFVKANYSTSGLSYFTFNVGGAGYAPTSGYTGGGGGAATTIKNSNGTAISWAAGGGGGASGWTTYNGGAGGAGGGTSGIAGAACSGTCGGLAAGGGAGTGAANGAGGGGNIANGVAGTGGGALGSVGGTGGGAVANYGVGGYNPDAAGGYGKDSSANVGGAGGGGGYYPGGGGGASNGAGGGGGGGSSFSTGSVITYTAGSSTTPGNNGDADYTNSAGTGGVGATNGKAGLVVICNAGGC